MINMALELNQNQFQQEVLAAGGTILVDFWAPWCGPCRMMVPVLDKFAEENPQVKVVKVNVDDNMELAEKYGISSIPCLIAFRDGKPYKSAVGVQPKSALVELTK